MSCLTKAMGASGMAYYNPCSGAVILGTKQEQESKGYATDIGVDSWPIDPKHPVNQHDR
jgi:hypothetical protein